MSPLNKEFKDIPNDKFHREAKVNCKLGERQHRPTQIKAFEAIHSATYFSETNEHSKASPAIDEAKVSFVIVIVIE